MLPIARFAASLGAAVALLLSAPAPAAFGDRDCSFGNAGAASVPGAFGVLMSGASAPDGALLLRMGFASTGSTVYRADAAGTTFSPEGSVSNINVFEPGTVVMGDGRTLVATGCGLSQCDGNVFNGGSPPGVRRGLANSSNPDTSFGTQGYATMAGFNNAGAGPILLADGRILVAGSFNGTAAIVRFNDDGSVDTTFGTGGVATNPDVSGNPYISVAVQSDGKILAIWQGELTRHLVNGAIDTSFGVAGKAIISVLSAMQVRVQPSDKILVAGVTSAGAARVARFTADGVLDTSVAAGAGYRTAAIPAGPVGGSFASYYPLAMMADGRPILVGASGESLGGIVRFGVDLEDDTTVQVAYAPSSAFVTASGGVVVGARGGQQVRRYLSDADAATCVPTTTALASSPNPSSFGQAVTLTAMVTPSSATGSVQFRNGAAVLGSATLSGGVATLSVSNLPEGTSSLTAVYADSGAALGSTSPAHSHTVTPRPATTTTLSSSPNPSASGQQVTLTAVVASQSGPGTPVGTIQFKDGASSLGSVVPLSSGTATLNISTLGDGNHNLTAVYSGDASFSPSTSNVVAHVVPGRLTINDPSVNAAAGATTLIFTVSLTAPSTSTVTVNYATSDRTATAGTNYTATSGTLTFDPGQTNKAVTVTIAQSQPGPNKDFFLTLTSPSNATLAKGAGIGTIAYTDTTTLAIYIDDVAVAEGASGTTLLGFNVTLSRPNSAPINVDFTTADGTGTSVVDYLPASGSITFARGVTQRWVLVPVVGNTLVQSNRTFFVNLANATGGATIARAQGTGTIIDDDPTPAASTVAQYRLYSDVTKEHLYTTDANEYAVLGTANWVQEGIAYTMFANSGTYNGEVSIPLYRLYHPGIRQHHWTTDANEVSTLVMTYGSWQYERIPGYLLPNAVGGSTPLYRLSLSNPPLHLWTTDANEKNVLTTPQYGWTYEGVIGEVLP